MQFFRGLIVGFSLISIVWIALILGQVGNPTITSRWVYDAYQKKESLIRENNRSKIIIVAGSNAMFGIDSKMLEKRYGKDVVNFGVNAGLFLPYILYRAKKVLKRGDIAILPLEYSMYVYDGEPNEQMIGYTYSFDPSFFWSLSLKEKFLLIWKTPLKRVIEGYMKTGTKPINYGLYGAHRLDNNGDEINSSISDMTKAERDAIANIKPTLYAKESKGKSIVSWRYLKRFDRWAKDNGICTIYTPPVFMNQKIYHSDKDEINFYKSLPKIAKANGLNFIGNPYDFMYPKSWFFNTDYHLNAEARERHTKKLIELLGDLNKRCFSDKIRQK